VHGNNQAHHIGIGKRNVMKIAASEERIGKILLGIGCNDDHGTVLGPDGFVDFNNIELHLIQNVQHIVLKIGVGLVDFINQ